MIPVLEKSINFGMFDIDGLFVLRAAIDTFFQEQIQKNAQKELAKNVKR